MYDFKFADIGEGIHEGTILTWNVKVGDKVNEGDTLVVVETDKVNAELPSPVTGIIVKVGPAVGETIHVGETVVVIDDGTGGEVPQDAPAQAAAPAAAPKAAPAAVAPSAPVYDFKFADIGEGIHEGTILTWNVKVGDKVNEGDTLVVVETDKVNAELPSPVTGIIVKVGPAVGETIHVGETVVIIGEEGTSLDAVAAAPVEEEEGGAGVVGEIEVSSEVMASSSEASTESTAPVATGKALATPVARQMAKDLGLDINKIVGTGANGRVLKEDITLAAQGKPAAAPAVASQPVAAAPVVAPQVTVPAGSDVEIVKISRLRKAIAKSMVTSKTVIPHTVLMDEIVVDALVDFRKNAKGVAEAKGIKLTYMALIMKAVVVALKEFPIFNASFNDQTDEVIIKKFINLGMAVDTPDGLIVPNIKNADRLSVFELAEQVRTLADETIERKVQMDKLQNGTFTITNFGSVGVSFGTPVINHPELAILGVGKISQKPVVENGEIKVASVLPLSLAVDHRIIDGADGGRFLMRIKELLSNPTLLLLS